VARFTETLSEIMLSLIMQKGARGGGQLIDSPEEKN